MGSAYCPLCYPSVSERSHKAEIALGVLSRLALHVEVARRLRLALAP